MAKIVPGNISYGIYFIEYSTKTGSSFLVELNITNVSLIPGPSFSYLLPQKS